MTQKPNIIYLLLDHQAYYGHGEMAGGPKIQRPNFEKFASGGIEFSHAYTCCPLCAPARRTMLTGLFPHTHRELTNLSFHEFDTETYLEKLAEAGYKNYYYGKWHAGPGTALDHECEGFSYPDYNNPYTKPEYKEYLKKYDLPHFEVRIQRSFSEPNSDFNRRLGINIVPGELHKIEGAACTESATGIMSTPKESHEAFFLADLACDRLRKIAQEGNTEPFHLRVDFWGPHQPYYATQEFLDLYPPESIPEYPNFQDDLRNKPKTYQSERNYPLNKLGKIVHPNPLPWSEWQNVLALCYAQQTLIDEAAGLILDTLDELGLSDNTLIIWTTDHGDAVACHGGHFDKDAYMPEEMMRVPMALSFPGVVPADQKSGKLVSTIDLAPTILDAAGTSFTNPVHGQSILPICKNKEAEWREDLMCETNGHFSVHIGRMILKDQYKYVWNERDMDELYDLKADPYEMNNLIDDETHQEILVDIKSRLEKWRQETTDNMTRKILRKDRAKFAREKAQLTTLVSMGKRKE